MAGADCPAKHAHLPSAPLTERHNASRVGKGGVTPDLVAAERYSSRPSTKGFLDQYISDVAAASGSTGNIYSIDTDYYDVVSSVKTCVSYKISGGTPLVAPYAFPAKGCKPAPGITACRPTPSWGTN